jgi:hypothetical protein
MAAPNKLMIAFAIGRFAFGAALVATPSRIGSSWLGEDADRPPVHIALRGLGVRDIALAGGSAAAALRVEPLRPWLIGLAAGDLVDLAATLAAGGSIPARARWGTVALAGGSAVAGVALAVAADR